MNPRVLVLGAGGRLGHKAAEAFRDAGWTVASLVRPGRAARAPAGTEIVEVDALDHAAVGAAARGADVILHALNPSYTDWSRLALPLAYSAITAAEATGATLMFPGNLYNYGSPMPQVIDETTPMRPSSRKGQVRVAMEDRMAEATERGMRAIILRAGDFYGGGRGSWLDLVLLKDIGRGRLTYPGPIDLVHEWAYLPDLVAALVRLAGMRDTLPALATFGFPGHAVTGQEFIATIEAVTKSKFTLRPMSWWMIKTIGQLLAMGRELSELEYLWRVPHRISGDKLRAAIGDVPHTPLPEAIAASLRAIGYKA